MKIQYNGTITGFIMYIVSKLMMGNHHLLMVKSIDWRGNKLKNQKSATGGNINNNKNKHTAIGKC